MRYSILFGTLAVTLFFAAGKSSAVTMDNPPGSYQQSCKNIKMRGDTLVARCKNYDNHWVDTTLDDVDRCGGDITNAGGQLTCSKNGAAPSGDYAQTCRDISMRYNTLRARCQTRDGQWVDTSLDSYNRCRGGIVNIDGHLRCAGDADDRYRDGGGDRDGDRNRNNGPRGSYSETCRNIDVRGNTLRARCQSVAGEWRQTSLDNPGGCVGDIVNDDGYLQCTRGGGRTVPRGSYSETCRQIYVRGDSLRARCQTSDGRWVWSQLNEWDDCRGGIVNLNGQLVCRKDRDRE
jgi:CVNH domain